MRQFPQKLSASGWDLGDIKIHPTTGFSGTIDSTRLLPLDVKYVSLPGQQHTNALVLKTLLQPENKVILLPERHMASSGDVDDARTSRSDAKILLDTIVGQGDPNLRVILDVGAQILELTNVQVAQEWLRLAHDKDPEVKAAVYVDDEEEIMVLDTKGGTEQLRTSPFADQLDLCVVFLDEAHTRGTDLRLPENYKAAVTLGANLTKDRLVQGKSADLFDCFERDFHNTDSDCSLHENAEAWKRTVSCFLRPSRDSDQNSRRRGRAPI